MNLEKILSGYLMDIGLEPDEKIIDRVLLFLNLIYEKNKIINLVGTKDKYHIFIRHFLDCISIYKYFCWKDFPHHQNLKIIDVGSGAGLPGILIGILNKRFSITLLDSSKKYTDFLCLAVRYLSLDNIEIIRNRAESISHSAYRESFDIVVSRAVSRLNSLCELLVPLCKIGGRVIMYKGKNVIKELDESGRAINLLGAGFDRLFEVKIPFLNEYRALVILNKYDKTPYNYPRKYAKIKKMPL